MVLMANRKSEQADGVLDGIAPHRKRTAQPRIGLAEAVLLLPGVGMGSGRILMILFLTDCSIVSPLPGF